MKHAMNYYQSQTKKIKFHSENQRRPKVSALQTSFTCQIPRILARAYEHKCARQRFESGKKCHITQIVLWTLWAESTTETTNPTGLGREACRRF